MMSLLDVMSFCYFCSTFAVDATGVWRKEIMHLSAESWCYFSGRLEIVMMIDLPVSPCTTIPQWRQKNLVSGLSCSAKYIAMATLCNANLQGVMLSPGQKSHFEHILNDCQENGPSWTKIYRFFEEKIINFILFKKFDKQNFQF